MKKGRLLCLVACGWLAGCAAVSGGAAPLGAAPAALWQYDYAAAKLGAAPWGGEVVADPLAPGGQALRVAYASGPAPAALTGDPAARDLLLAGRGTVRVWVRGKDLNDIANGLKIRVWLVNQTTHRMYGYYDCAGVAYGVRAGESGYRELPISFEVPDDPAPYTLNLAATWAKQNGDRQPVVWISKLELAAHDAAGPYISGLLRTRFTCAPGGESRLSVTVVNPTARAWQGTLRTEDCFGLAGRRVALATPVTLAPRERRVLELGWTQPGPEGGHEYRFSLLDPGGRELDADRIGMGVARDPRILSLPTSDFETGRGTRAPTSYVYPASHTEGINLFASALADRENRCTRSEYFGWSWGDIGGFVPPQDPYVLLWGNFWISLKQYRQEMGMARAAGIHIDSYILGAPTGEAAYELFHRHPDWFVYGADGQALSYNMEAHAGMAHGSEFEHVNNNDSSAGGGFDPTNPQVRRYVADQIIDTAQEMGFQGCRWDVACMNVVPKCYRIDGTEIAPTPPEADRLSAESLRAVKQMVNAVLPDYTWGYNGAGPEGVGNITANDLARAEMCRNHGWMLDEVPYGYNAKTSPYHYWAAYSKRMLEWGEHIRELGGLYDPYTFDRGYNPASQSEMDYLYASLFRLLAGARSELPFYKNNGALVGDLPWLAFRYNDLYSGDHLRLQPESQTQITVSAPATLWWKGYVFSNQSPDGTAQTLVHLVNSPAVDEIGENPDSRVRPPVRDVQITCQAQAGRLPARAWLVTAEPLTPDAEPQVQALPLRLTPEAGAVSVSVPAVLYFKTVVFEY